jgi:hypothetical protein
VLIKKAQGQIYLHHYLYLKGGGDGGGGGGGDIMICNVFTVLSSNEFCLQ